MDTNQIIEAIDAEIARLEEAKHLLGITAVPAKTARKTAPAKKAAGKRTMSAEGRARIAAAQKARWAKEKRDKSA
jgi:hypothetical protein